MSKDNKCPSDYRNFSGTNQIFNPYNNNSGGCEISSPIHDIEKRLMHEITRVVVEALDIGWSDRESFRRVLNTAIQREIRQLLLQYQDFSVDYLGKEINRKFSINEEVEFGHALHAKLKNHFDAIEDLIHPPDQNPEETPEPKKK
jgi:hypothetical protein